ncbi:hypothetical protein C3L33_14468, partial [Rhododendron williamsianum]
MLSKTSLPLFLFSNQENIWKAAPQTSTAYQGTSGGTANGGTAICFSTCDDTTVSIDSLFSSYACTYSTIYHFSVKDSTMTGALTSSFIEAVKNERNLTYGRLLQSIRTKFCETQNRQKGSESSSTPSTLQ